MTQHDQDGPPWVAIFGACVALIVFLLALSQGLGQAVPMVAVAFSMVFAPVGLVVLTHERWRW